jgi:phenylalanyl-tRNA synthetase beta chain
MNIKISDNWLRCFLKTDVKPKELGRLLSYYGPSVEYVNKVGKDFVYDIEVTTNRPDMMSVIGIAREANAILKSFNKKSEFLSLKFSPKKVLKNELFLKVEIKNKNLCPRFTVLILDNIKITSSPKWMKERLELSGIRSLNNVVDVSNYVMLETGQPMHIFDYDKIIDQKMILRRSKKGESIITLDGIRRNLPEGAIVIEDKNRIIDLCGIMGGANSAVGPETKRIIVFVQTYNSLLIRKTCQSLGFWTEAAQRFEKGIDLEGIVPALWRTVELLEETTSGQIKSKLIDIKNVQYKSKKVKVKFSKINQLIGTKISSKKVISILGSLGFKVRVVKNVIKTKVPSWRANDINISEDLIEEVARIYGYHNLPSILPSNQILEERTSSEFFWEKRIKTLLRYLGFAEIYNYSFISAKDLENFNLNKNNCLKINNPLTNDWGYMRPSLIPSILKMIAENEKNFSKMKIFELSNIYLKKTDNVLPDEFLVLAGALIDKDDKNLFLKAKGVLESLFEELGVSDIEFKTEEGGANIFFKNELIGSLEILDEKISSRFKLNSKPVIFNLNFIKLIKRATSEKKYRPIFKYPLVKMDIAIIVDEKVLYKDLLKVMKKAGGNLVKNIKLFDIYRGQQIGPDKKSLAFSIEYGSDNKTLAGEEAKEIQNKIIQALQKDLNAKIRDNLK